MPKYTTAHFDPQFKPAPGFTLGAVRRFACAFSWFWDFLDDLFQRVGEDEIVEVDHVDRGTVRTAMDSRLAEVDGLGAFGLQLLVQHQNAVEPEPRVPFVLVLRPMDVHRQLVPFADREICLPVRAVAPEVPRTVLDERPAAFFRL